MIKRILQVVAFIFPAPVNIWILRLAGAKIGRGVTIHPGVLLLSQKIRIGHGARIKFGTMINVRTFQLGRKSYIGFFTLVKGYSDLIVGDASIIGPKNMINCDREVVIGNYSGVGPGSYLYTHGSGLPVTEGYRATFAPIHIKDKVWVSMRVTIGPGVTIETGTNVMPGTVLLESIGPKRLVVGNPAKLNNFPAFLIPRKPEFCAELANQIITGYCDWSNEYQHANWKIVDGRLTIKRGTRGFSLSVDSDSDIVILTEKGKTSERMYLNLADLSTDQRRHPEKTRLEAFIRLQYGLIFLEHEGD